MSLLRRLFGTRSQRRLARYERALARVNALRPELRLLSDDALRARARALRARARDGAALDALLVEAFALGREAARRTIGLEPFDVQVLGAMALHEGLIVEMKTGEGKTLVATLPAFLDSLAGEGVHVVTVNDYLAQRDAEWMGPLYRLLEVSVGVILEEMGEDRDEEIAARRAAYACDVTYGTNHEIAFDYLRDNLAVTPGEIVHRGFDTAIIDEVDFLIIDEARTPLIISGPAREDTGLYERVDRVTRRFEEGYHYVVEPKTRTSNLTEAGIDAVQRGLEIDNLADLQHLELYHAVHQSILAHGVYKRDVDYIVDEGSVYIVDEFTGRVSHDKRYADGLHQAIEAKEGVEVQAEDRTLAKVTYQTFYGRYGKLAGMTGTAWSEREEFRQTYGRDVQVIPTHKPMIRSDYADVIFDGLDEKHDAIVEEIVELRAAGRPVLVGSTSVRESEQISRRLRAAGVPHEVLNAKNHAAEAAVIAQAGRKGAVTISTNMAGRGTDIILGGNPDPVGVEPAPGTDREALRARCAAEREEVRAAGGLHVIGTAHHESVRIDDQLRGRAGRQGDPGSSQFMVCLDDEVYQKFGRVEIRELRAELARTRHPRGAPIESGAVSCGLRGLQRKVDEENRGIRRDVLKYDLVVHAQRETIYGRRRTLVTGEGYDPDALVREVVQDLVERCADVPTLVAALSGLFHAPFELSDRERADPLGAGQARALALLRQREEAGGAGAVRELGRRLLLDSIDELWTEHLSALERLEEGIGLRGYAQIDPVLEWRQEATAMWQELLQQIRRRAVGLWFSVDVRSAAAEGPRGGTDREADRGG